MMKDPNRPLLEAMAAYQEENAPRPIPLEKSTSPEEMENQFLAGYSTPPRSYSPPLRQPRPPLIAPSPPPAPKKKKAKSRRQLNPIEAWINDQ